MTSDQPPSLVSQLRWALHHLYDPGELRRSPLEQLLGLDAQKGPTALRRLLLEAIEGLKPPAGAPPDSKGWRIYRALYHRYSEQFPPQQVARALGLSERQLRRQETLALRVLAEYLVSHYDLAAELALEASAPGLETESMVEAPSREQELEYLARSLPSEAVSLEEILQSALRTAAPLQNALGVTVECSLPPDLPRLAGQGASLRQTLLTTLTAAIRAVPGGTVHIGAQALGPQVQVDLRPSQDAAGGPCLLERYAESLGMARHLLGPSGGSLQVEASDDGRHPFAARLVLPAAQQATVLVIDDNADTLQLFRRYFSGTSYLFIGARDPEQAVALARELKPQIILLDVMLPGVDGWEVLGRLREHPTTSRIPVIVCTILAEEDLALALGAAAFLRKPVARADLLAALERLVRHPVPGPS